MGSADYIRARVLSVHFEQGRESLRMIDETAGKRMARFCCITGLPNSRVDRSESGRTFQQARRNAAEVLFGYRGEVADTPFL